MFDWIVAGAALLLGGGTPSPRLIDLVGAFTPPVIGPSPSCPFTSLDGSCFPGARACGQPYLLRSCPEDSSGVPSLVLRTIIARRFSSARSR